MGRGNPIVDEVATPVPPMGPAGTPAGFGEVFAAERDAAYRFAVLLGQDHHVAEDVVAEAFARTWVHWERGRVHDPRAYVRRAIVNEFRSRWRRRRLEGRVREVAAEGGQYEDSVAGRDELLQALASLPVTQRAVLVCRFHEDMSERATAEVLGRSVGTVKSQTSRGLARLRLLLEER